MSQLRLASPLTDHLVLKRERENLIWGWDTPGQCIEVTVENAKRTLETATTFADSEGRFFVKCPILPVGGPYRIRVVGSCEILISDVMVGEVWLASGQSNMEFPVDNCDNAAAEIASAHYGAIRMLKVPKRPSDVAEEQFEAQWQVCSPECVGGFSAVGYFFARELHQRLGVPVGVIDASWGGTYVEAWMSLEGLRPVMPELAEELAERVRLLPNIDQLREEYLAEVRKWERRSLPADPGNIGMLDGWANTDFNDRDWKTMELPRYWQSVGLDFNGVVWFRKEVELPKSWVGKELVLELGAIDDYDQTYFNGVLVGEHPDGTPEAYALKREYRIPAALVRPGRNVIAVRVFDHCGQGGFAGPSSEMTVSKAEGSSRVVGVAGLWRYAVELEIPLVPMSVFQTLPPPPKALAPEHAPAALFHGMIAPLIPYRLSGFLFYQGENNVEDYAHYRDRLIALVRDWRTRFGQGSLPFAFVQLAGYQASGTWPYLREAQYQATFESRCFMATAIDVGDKNDVHPRDKQTVGKRLALLALANCYGKSDVVCYGPEFLYFEPEGGCARVFFRHAQGLRSSDGQTSISGFAVAGKDRVFHAADAHLEGETVVVSAAAVAAVYAVRYAFRDYCEVNLVNSAGLPALPFRTDGMSPN